MLDRRFLRARVPRTGLAAIPRASTTDSSKHDAHNIPRRGVGVNSFRQREHGRGRALGRVLSRLYSERSIAIAARPGVRPCSPRRRSSRGASGSWRSRCLAASMEAFRRTQPTLLGLSWRCLTVKPNFQCGNRAWKGIPTLEQSSPRPHALQKTPACCPLVLPWALQSFRFRHCRRYIARSS